MGLSVALLPFLGPDTDSDQFESFCHDLLARTPEFDEVRRWGVSGDKQDGIDILAVRDGDEWAFQCKREKQFGPQKVTDAIAMATLPADQYVLLLGRTATAAARRTAEGADWKLWDATDLSQRARALPIESGVQLVRAHFGHAVTEAFLGVSADLPWLPLETFFKPFLKPDRLFTLNHALAGRETDVQTLLDFTAGDKRVALVSGRGGIGKSRLVLEVGRRLECGDAAVRVIDPDREIRRDDLKMLPSVGSILLIADDAHRRSDIAALARLVAEASSVGRKVSLLLTTRPYGLSALRSSVTSGGIDQSEIHPTIALSDLSEDDLRDFACNALGPDLAQDDHLVYRLVHAVGDSPLVLSLGAELVRRGQIDPAHLLDNDDFRESVLDRFRDEALGNVVPSVSPSDATATLQIIAAAGPLRTDKDAVVEAAADITGLAPVKFRQTLSALESAGIVIRQGRQVRVVPDVLADHLLTQAALSSDGTSTGYAEQVFEAMSDSSGPTVLRNLAELDWRQRRNAEPTDPLRRTWASIVYSFLHGDADARVRILKLVQPAAHYLPDRVLNLCYAAADKSIPDPEVRTGYTLTQADVLRQLPELLKRAVHTLNADDRGRALDLLWRLAQDEDGDFLSSYSEDAQRTLVELAKPGKHRSYRWHQTILDAAEEWAKTQAAEMAAWDGDPSTLPHFPASRVITSTLDRSVDLSWSDGTSYYSQTGWPLAHLPHIRAVRRRALCLLEQYSMDAGVAGAIAIAIPLADHVKNRESYQGPEDPEVIGAFESESRWALAILGRLLKAYPDPYLADIVWQRTHWFAYRGPASLRRRAVRRLRTYIEEIPDWPLTRALHRLRDNWVGPPSDDEGSQASWETVRLQSEAQHEIVARAYLGRDLPPHIAAEDLSARLDLIRHLDEWTHPSGHDREPHPAGFFKAIGQIGHDYASLLAGALLRRQAGAHGSHVAALVAGARKRDAVVEKLTALVQGETTDRAAAAQFLSHVFLSGEPDEENGAGLDKEPVGESSDLLTRTTVVEPELAFLQK